MVSKRAGGGVPCNVCGSLCWAHTMLKQRRAHQPELNQPPAIGATTPTPRPPTPQASQHPTHTPLDHTHLLWLMAKPPSVMAALRALAAAKPSSAAPRYTQSCVVRPSSTAAATGRERMRAGAVTRVVTAERR
jgi:hypothetical protein